jgi:hypothetical protein
VNPPSYFNSGIGLRRVIELSFLLINRFAILRLGSSTDLRQKPQTGGHIEPPSSLNLATGMLEGIKSGSGPREEA